MRLVSLLPPSEDVDEPNAVWSRHLSRLLATKPVEVSLPALGGGRAAEMANKGKAGSEMAVAQKAPPPQLVMLSERFRGQLEYGWVRLVQRFLGAIEVHLPALGPPCLFKKRP